MHRCWIIALTVSCICANLTSQRRQRGGPPPELEHFTTEESSFESKALGGAKSSYRVFLPKGYADEANAKTLYPLVIWLHGMWEDHNRFYTRGGAKALDALAAEDEIPDLVFVCANGGRSSFYIDAVGEDANYASLIGEDLLAHCEATYRVRPERSARALAGVSMGGYGALMIALDHPDKFGAVAAHSAALLPKKMEDLETAFPWLERFGGAKRAMAPIFGEDPDPKLWRESNLLTRVETVDPESIDGLRIHFDCGTDDRYGFFGPNKELHALFTEREIDHSWEAIDGGGHGWRSGYNQAAIPASMRFLAAGFAVKEAAAGLSGLLGGQRAEPVKREPDKSDVEQIPRRK